jgi:hypothetical protein
VAHTLGQALAGKYVGRDPADQRSHRQAQTIVKARKTTCRGVATWTTARQRPADPGAPNLWKCPDSGP